MDLTLLQNAGVDTESVVKRFLGNEQLLVKMMKMFLSDPNYSLLCEAADKGDDKAVFSAAHTLKGLCGNFSMTELYNLFSEQVILMRADEWGKAYEMMPEIKDKFGKMTAAVEAWLKTV